MSPFPWLPMLAIATGLISHSYTLSSLFPYVGYMVQHIGVTDDKDEAGFYAGYLSSAFMIGRFSSSYFWGRYADRHGRLPVMYIGLWVIATMSIGFGLSTNFYMAMACRFLLGALNGMVATAKTMISEVCGSEHEVRGMSFITGSWSVGFVIGPGLGGLLAEPAKHYPRFFSETGLFGRFPYLLPNVFGAALALLALPMVFFFLHETNPAHSSLRLANGNPEGLEFKPLSTSETDLEEDDDTIGVAIEEGRLPNQPLTTRAQVEEQQDQDRDEQHARIEMVTLSLSSEPQVPNNNNYSNNDNRNASQNNSPATALRAKNTTDLPTVAAYDNNNNDDDDEGNAPDGYRGEKPSNSYEGKRFAGADGGEDKGEASGALSTGTVDYDRGGGPGCCRRRCCDQRNMLADGRIRTNLLVYGLFSFITIGFEEIYPLWALSTVARGGLDWTTKEIGRVLAVCGVLMMLFQFLGYPIVVKMLGVKQTQRVGALTSVPTYFLFPLLVCLRGYSKPLNMATLLLLFVMNTCNSALFVNVALAINNSVSPVRRGELNGLAMMVGSLAKALGPSIFSVMFAWSINRPRPLLLGSPLVFLLLGAGMLVVAVAGWDTIAVEHDDTDAVVKDTDKEGEETELMLPASKAGFDNDQSEEDSLNSKA